MLHKIFNTNESITALITRITLGLVLLPHGLQKLVGAFGGSGFSGTMEAMTGIGLPGFVVFLIIIGESFGALSLILGIGTRFSAASITVIMLGALFIHLPNGFFMNWFGSQSGEGFEYHVLAIGLGVASFINGGGILSLDKKIASHSRNNKVQTQN